MSSYDAVSDGTEATNAVASINLGSDVTDAEPFITMNTDETDETDARRCDDKKVSPRPPIRASGQAQDFKRIYNMDFPKRGFALIMNNVDFTCGMPRREGSDVDSASLQQRFEELDFIVRVQRNITVDKMKATLKEAATANHSQLDCFACVILSHGEEGVVYGTDGTMKITDILDPFKGHKCDSLSKKPKIFFIQACRGMKLDEGVTVHSDAATFKDDMEVQDVEIKIPSEADFLVHYSTVEGYYAWRNSSKGSWFIQALSKQLQEHGKEMEFLQLLTRVNYDVAFNFESNTSNMPMTGKKQMPCLTSQLTKELYFHPK